MIIHFNPINGNNQAPAKVEQVPARLLIEQSKANEVASFPGKVLLAIQVIVLRKINIPIKLNIMV
jgi:hypothetical protein